MAGRIAYYGNIVKDGLVLNLDASKRDSYPGSGTTWNDISGFQNNGTLVNGPTYNSNNYGSMVFDGVDDYVNIPNNNSPITNLTYEIILRIDAIPDSSTYRSIWQKSVNWNGTTGISLQMIYGYLTFSYGATWYGAARYLLSNLTVGNWYCITSTVGDISGSDVRLYINGALVTTGGGTTPTTTSDLTLGLGSSPNRFSGIIGSFKCYNRPLSANEVLQNYNAIKGRYGL